jgi:hypothetical protein
MPLTLKATHQSQEGRDEKASTSLNNKSFQLLRNPHMVSWTVIIVYNGMNTANVLFDI